jgi:hypothetical protein
MPTAAKRSPSETMIAASARGCQLLYGSRATDATRTTNGKRKNRSSIVPARRSSDQRSETAVYPTKAAAGQESIRGSSTGSPSRAVRTSNATTATATTA